MKRIMDVLLECLAIWTQTRIQQAFLGFTFAAIVLFSTRMRQK